MANVIRIKRKTTAGAPTTAQLAVGEFCYNTVDKTLSIKRDASNIDTFKLPADILANAALTGTPTAPNPPADDSTTKIATTSWVQGEISGSGGGDMMAATYDPGNVAADAFSMDNMVEGTTTKILTNTERTKLSGIEDGADVTDAANVAAAGAVMTTDTDASAFSFIVDEDTMTSNSDTLLPTQQSVKAYVDTSISNLVAAAPGALDTLNELAAALGDDPNFASTMTTSLAGKMDVDGEIDGGTIS